MKKLVGKHPIDKVILKLYMDDYPIYSTSSSSNNPVVTTVDKKELLQYCTNYIEANRYNSDASYREKAVLTDIIRKFCT